MVNKKDLDMLAHYLTLTENAYIIQGLSDRRVLFANDAATSLLPIRLGDEVSPSELLANLTIPQDRHYVATSFQDLPAKKQIRDVECRLKAVDAAVKFLCCSAIVMPSQDVIVYEITDITKRKQFENYLIEFGAKKNSLLDTLMHNLSGVIMVMQNLSDQAQRSLQDADNTTLKTYLNLLGENARHCIHMINDLWHEEHLQSAEISVKNSRVDIVELIRLLYYNLADTHTARNFHLDLNVGSLFVRADDVKLMQVINNLISNAVKFTTENGNITIGVYEEKEYIIIRVEDDGIGVPDELKPYLFDKKGIAGRPGLNGEKSIGMGLSICRNLVEMMGGKIWVANRKPKGSIFHFSIPKTD